MPTAMTPSNSQAQSTPRRVTVTERDVIGKSVVATVVVVFVLVVEVEMEVAILLVVVVIFTCDGDC